MSAPREKPILMSAPMVRAILAGTKTQTRRVVKPVPAASVSNIYLPFAHEPNDWQGYDENAGLIRWYGRCPYGQPGERLWVRETWATFDGWTGYFYGADDHSFGIGESDDPDHVPEHALRWRPSIHMPRAASRITLDITGVRVERLQEISDADVLAEGTPGAWVDWTEVGCGFQPNSNGPETRQFFFRKLWKSICGHDSWNANPWVWVIEFQPSTKKGSTT